MQMERIWVVWLVWAAMVVAEMQGLSGCLQKERMGLMELRKSMKPINLTRLPSDCCSWDGVNCSATTGRVQSLDFFSFDGEYLPHVLNISLLLPFEELLHLEVYSCLDLINPPDLMKLTRLEWLKIDCEKLSNIVSLQVFAKIKNLKYLDLSDNSMNINLKGVCEMNNIIELRLRSNNIRGHLPPCIGNLTQLQILHVGYNQISGNIPSTIGNLSHLSSLSLGGNYFSGSFSLHSLANNSKLENLLLSRYDNNFQLETETQSWFPSFQLLTLDLSNTNLNKMSDSVIPTFLLHQSQLMVIDLSHNKLQDTFPSWLLQNNSKLDELWMTNNSLTGNLILPNFIHGLTELRISDNKIDGKLPDNLQVFLPALQDLIISNNRFEGNLPSSFGALNQLQALDLSFNSFSGKLPKTLFANNTYLYSIDFSNNLLDGEISLNLTTLPSLSTLRLNSNKFNGTIKELPSTSLSFFDVSNNLILGRLSEVFLPALLYFNISKNRFEGNLPLSFGALNRLQLVDLSFNSFSGKLPKTLFANSTDLYYLDFSNNLLDGEIPLNLTTLPSMKILVLNNNKFNGSIEELPSTSFSQLEVFDISNNLISGKLSNLIADFSFLSFLLVSNNSLEGGIPDKLCHISILVYLDISHNNLSGLIPSCLRNSSISFLYMRNCGLSGVIPDELFLNSTLIALDLSYNDFSSSVLPNWIYTQHNLQMLLMAGLQLEGEISTHLCELENIKIMDLSHNNFSGVIPSCLFKMPFWMAESYDDYINSTHRHSFSIYLITSSNGFFGVEFTTKGTSTIFKGSILNVMNGLDVSSNKLSGQIPPQIGYSEAIHALNLSNNRLWGSIPNNISRLREIESLDLSSNNLSGEIPSDIFRLSFISTFNVSNNNLSGSIPTGGQFSNFDEQNYRGNEFLCGPLLHRLCTTSSSPSTTPPDEQEDKDDETIFERTSFWWSFIAAYVSVFISAVVLVGINTRCSRFLFHTVDVVCSKLVYVFVKLKFVLGKK